MATFSASDAGLGGFLLVRRNPRLVLVWGVVMALASFVMSSATVLAIGPVVAELQASGGNPDPDSALGNVGVLLAFYAGLLAFLLVYYSVVIGGVYRAVLRPADSRSAYLRFGGDEFRLIGLMIVQWLLGGAVSVVGLIPVFVLIGIGSATQNTALAIIGGVVGGLAWLVLMIYLLGRFSLAKVQTFASGKINIFGSWALTRGRFWPVLGAQVLGIVCYLLVALVFAAVMALIALVLGGGFGGVTSIFRPDMTTLASYFSPMMILYTVVGGFIAALGMMILYSPAAIIYRDIAEPSTADTFS